MASVYKSPTSGSDGTDWEDVANAYDDSMGTYAKFEFFAAFGTGWCDFIEFDHASILCNSVRVYLLIDEDAPDQITLMDIDYYNGSWNHLYNGAFTTGEWIEKALPSSTAITKFRVSFYVAVQAGVTGAEVDLYEVDFGEELLAKTSSDTGSGVDASGKARTWGGFLEFIIATITAYRVRFMALKEANVDFIDLDVYYGGAWHHLYQGSYNNMEWVSKSFDQQTTVTKARVRFYQDPTYTVKLYELQFFAIIS